MNVFEAVKQSVTTRQAAEHYGIHVGRNGMACCPFHHDKTPSMKLDRRYHCFGCGADGDVIDFAAALYGLGKKDAAVQLAQDFGLSYEDWKPPGKAKKPKPRQKSPEEQFQEAKNRCFRILTDYLHLLTNNNAEIRRVKARIEQLSKQAQQEFSGWEFDRGRVEMNREDNRLQVFFDGKPDADTRAELKSSGFRWAPSVGAWQRQLTDNAIRAADRLECIKPLSGEKRSQLQKKPSILQTMREQGEKVQTEPEKKAPSGRDAER